MSKLPDFSEAIEQSEARGELYAEDTKPLSRLQSVGRALR